MAGISVTGKVFYIVQKKQYVVLLGGRLWIYTTEGQLVSYKRDIVNPHKVAFLSGDRVLVECGRQKAYILLSLEDGSEILRIAQPKLDMSSRSFVISADERYIYDWFDLKEDRYLIRIDTATWEKEICALQQGLRVVSDMCCGDSGELYLLEHHYEETEDKVFSRNGIRCVRWEELASGKACSWKHQWDFSAPQISALFVRDTKSVLTNDLHLYNPVTNEIYSLLGTETQWEKPHKPPSSIQLSDDGKYLTLHYWHMDIVVDLAARKIVARYAANHTCGCFINNKFWLYDGQRVVEKAFPLLETVVSDKYQFWRP